MKNIILTVALCILITGCRAQNQPRTITQKTGTGLHIPIVDKNFEKFDSIKFENRTEKSKPVYEQKLENGTIIRLMNIKAGMFYRETHPDSYFSISKMYFPNGNIKEKGLCFTPSCVTFQKGIWYEFDEQGRLIKETNYDQYYKFSFEQVLAFCEKEGIQVDKDPILQSTGFHTLISRGRSTVFDDVSWWEIEWLKKPSIIEVIRLDGHTGAVKSREENKYINN